MLIEKYLSVLPSAFLYPAVGFRTGFESKPENLIIQEAPYILKPLNGMIRWGYGQNRFDDLGFS